MVTMPNKYFNQLQEVCTFLSASLRESKNRSIGGQRKCGTRVRYCQNISIVSVTNFNNLSTVTNITSLNAVIYYFYYCSFLPGDSSTISIMSLLEKMGSIRYGYRKLGTHARVFSQTLAHGNSKNENKTKQKTAEECKTKGVIMERSKAT